MNPKFKMFALVIVLPILFSLAMSQDYRQENVLAAPSEEAVNQIVLDVTYDPETKTYSLAGLSEEQLKLLGAPELQQIVWTILERFDSLSMEINNSELNLDADGAKLATINWDGETRQKLYDLLDSYGMQMSPASKLRAEEWLGKADIVLNIRNSPYLSKPLVIDLATLIMVDISKEGKVAVEGFDTGVTLEPVVSDLAKAGGIDNATLCWSKGLVYSEVNGNSLPQITVHQEGLKVVDNALGLNLGDIEAYFEAQVGASVSFAGSGHESTECGK